MTAWIIAGVMALGLVGTVVPGIPGIALIWGAALAYGLLEGFGGGGAAAFIVITLLSIGGGIATYVVPPKRASDAGAARSSIYLGIALAIVGAFVIPVVGLFVGGIGGIYVGERSRGAEHPAAYKATVATLIGLGIGIAIELTAAVLVIATWLVWVFAI